MRSLFAGLMVAALAALTGCNQGTPGGPGTTEGTANIPVAGVAADMFNLEAPTMSTKLKQGGTKDLAISVARGTHFDEDVTLEFAGLPKGVSVDPASPVIRHGETKTKIALTVADNASLGDFTIKLTGHPTKGANATNEFNITVAKR